jgi:hypothetical protein
MKGKAGASDGYRFSEGKTFSGDSRTKPMAEQGKTGRGAKVAVVTWTPMVAVGVSYNGLLYLALGIQIEISGWTVETLWAND